MNPLRPAGTSPRGGVFALASGAVRGRRAAWLGTRNARPAHSEPSHLRTFYPHGRQRPGAPPIFPTPHPFPMTASFLGRAPRLGREVFVAPSAAVVGDVTLGDGASVWYGASLRGDVHWIEVGAGSNVQDNATVHVSRGTHPCRIGAGVTVGHNAVVHGCTVEDDVLIGMGAVVLDGATIGAGSIVGAGAVVTKDTAVPPGSLVLGTPARVVRPLAPEALRANRANAAHYVRMSRMYLGLDAAEGSNPFYTDAR